jgi:hypothetical protein
MNNSLQLIRQLVSSGVGFASLLYRSKGEQSLALYTIILGAKYSNLLEKSKKELEEIILTLSDATEIDAANQVMASIQKSIDAHANGEQNEDYTKKGQYVALGNGVNLNSDNTIQLFGLVQSKVVIEAGPPKKAVKSSAMTIAKNKIKKMLSMSKFREFALDTGNINVVKSDGQTLILE